MSEKINSRPKLSPVWKVLKKACTIYWTNINKFIKMMLWALLGFAPFVVLVILSFLLQNFWQLGNPIYNIIQIILAILIGLSFLWILYYAARIYLSFYLMIKNNFTKTTRAQFKDSRPFVWSYISLILLIIVILLPLALIGMAFLLSINLLHLAPLVLAALLFVVLILFASFFVLAIFFGLAGFSLVFENLSGLQALKRSIFLIEKYWWAVLGRMMFVGLAFWLFSLVISIPLTFAMETSAFFSMWSAIISFMQILVAPIYLLYMATFYKNLVRIKAQ